MASPAERADQWFLAYPARSAGPAWRADSAVIPKTTSFRCQAGALGVLLRRMIWNA
jgi:hypothetical protein